MLMKKHLGEGETFPFSTVAFWTMQDKFIYIAQEGNLRHTFF